MKNLILALLITAAIDTTMHAEEPTLTRAELTECVFEDPGAEPIWGFFVAFCDKQPAPEYHEKQFQALAKLPPKLRDVCILIRYELLWGNGGTQSSALMEDKPSSEKLLKMTADAYERFGDKKRAKMMSEILSLIDKHDKTLEAAVRANKLEEFTSPLERYDELWENVDFEYFSAILKDIKANPADYTYP
jgi:hypothetical protein